MTSVCMTTAKLRCKDLMVSIIYTNKMSFSKIFHHGKVHFEIPWDSMILKTCRNMSHLPALAGTQSDSRNCKHNWYCKEDGNVLHCGLSSLNHNLVERSEASRIERLDDRYIGYSPLYAQCWPPCLTERTAFEKVVHLQVIWAFRINQSACRASAKPV